MGQNVSDRNEQLRIISAAILSVAGLFLAAALVIFLVLKGGTVVKLSTDVVAIVGLFTSILGTLVGAFFGLQIGASGVSAEREKAQRAEARVNRLLATLPPTEAQAFLNQW